MIEGNRVDKNEINKSIFDNENHNGSHKGQNATKSMRVHRLNNDHHIKSGPKSMHVHRFANDILKLDADVHEELRKLQEKWALRTQLNRISNRAQNRYAILKAHMQWALRTS